MRSVQTRMNTAKADGPSEKGSTRTYISILVLSAARTKTTASRQAVRGGARVAREGRTRVVVHDEPKVAGRSTVWRSGLVARGSQRGRWKWPTQKPNRPPLFVRSFVRLSVLSSSGEKLALFPLAIPSPRPPVRPRHRSLSLWWWCPSFVKLAVALFFSGSGCFLSLISPPPFPTGCCIIVLIDCTESNCGYILHH